MTSRRKKKKVTNDTKVSDVASSFELPSITIILVLSNYCGAFKWIISVVTSRSVVWWVSHSLDYSQNLIKICGNFCNYFNEDASSRYKKIISLNNFYAWRTSFIILELFYLIFKILFIIDMGCDNYRILSCDGSSMLVIKIMSGILRIQTYALFSFKSFLAAFKNNLLKLISIIFKMDIEKIGSERRIYRTH